MKSTRPDIFCAASFRRKIEILTMKIYVSSLKESDETMLGRIILVCLSVLIPIVCAQRADSQTINYVSAGKLKSADIDPATINKIRKILALEKANPGPFQ